MTELNQHLDALVGPERAEEARVLGDVDADVSVYRVVGGEPIVRIDSRVEPIGREESVRTTFIHHMPEPLRAIPAALGVETTDELNIALQTDALAPEAEGSTRYYFDAAGHYGKVVSIPRDVQGDRPDVIPGMAQLFGNADQRTMVRSDFTPGDFELAGAALSLLRQRLESLQGHDAPTHD